MPDIGRFEEPDAWELQNPDTESDQETETPWAVIGHRSEGDDLPLDDPLVYDGFIFTEAVETALENEAEDKLNAQIYRDEQSFLKTSPKKKQLKRELQREALERLESLEKTEEQFQEVLKQWDRLLENSDRRFRDHVSVRGDVPLEYGMAEYGYKFPFYLNTVYWESLLAGHYLDVLFDCPFEIDDVTSVESVSTVLRGLKSEYKELLNYLVIRRYSTERVGAMFNQTDRNVRKKIQRLLNRIRREVHSYIISKLDKEEKITDWEYRFMIKYESGEWAFSDK